MFDRKALVLRGIAECVTDEELHELLDQAVTNEDYETAARLRDEISKR